MNRITTLMTSNLILSDINQGMNKLQTTEQQLSSGYRINKPSDDPYGATLAVQLKDGLAGLTQYNKNVTDGTNWTQTADSALTSINNIVERARELTVQAANGTMGASELQADSSEVSQLIDQIKQTANTQYNGQYVFTGQTTQNSPAPYQVGANDTFGGTFTQANREVSPQTWVPVNVDGSQILGNGSASDPAGQNLLYTLRQIQTDMAAGNSAGLNTDLGNLDKNLSTLQGTQVTIGTIEQRLQFASSRIQDVQTSTNSQLASTEDVDFAQASIDYSTETAAFQAALKAGANIVQSSLLDFLQ
jgi:flagellar hook-associated protein 3 FlgL